MNNYVAYHVHTELSLLDSTTKCEDYIKKAIKGRTDIEGGLVLTGLIELGFGLTNSDNENYYNSFIVMSGINGILEQKDESNNYTYTDPAV